jgi:hypothetical protein
VQRQAHRFAASATAALLVACASTAAASAAPASNSNWSSQADQVCSVWLAKLKTTFATPVTTAGLYPFALKVKKMETQELVQLEQIPGRDATGTAALGAVHTDIAELDSAIVAWNKGNETQFATILKKYLNDERPKSAFALAGATSCG